MNTATGYDCLIIPNAVKAIANTQVSGNHFCGKVLVTAAAAAGSAIGATVCSKFF